MDGRMGARTSSCVVAAPTLSPAVALNSGALLPTRGAAALTTTALRLERKGVEAAGG